MQLLIGATGFLGQHLASTYSPEIAQHRFENSEKDWKDSYDHVDTIWLVARCCRKLQPRRDYHTFQKEVSGISKICRAFPHAHIVFTSTKVVYGLTDDHVRPVSRKALGKYFVDSQTYKNQIINVPFSSNAYDINLKNLNHDHRWYAMTKLACEQIITQQTYTILRIWDIQQ